MIETESTEQYESQQLAEQGSYYCDVHTTAHNGICWSCESELNDFYETDFAEWEARWMAFEVEPK